MNSNNQKILIQENISLAPLTSFKIGGPARYFITTAGVEELNQALLWAKEQRVDYFILGSGSNLLVADQGYNGLVIKPQLAEYQINQQGIWFGASVSLIITVKNCLVAGYSGLENLAGIPGTVGGAIYGNAGAYGSEIGQYVAWVEALVAPTVIKKYLPAECNFTYRSSRFKDQPGVILRAGLKLTQVSELEQEAGREKFQQILASRLKKNISGGLPSAGSVFKNLFLQALPAKTVKELRLTDKAINGKVAAGLLIEACGLKGKILGAAKVSTANANCIVNTGQATAEQVAALINDIKQQVQNRFNVPLQEEIRLIGFRH